MSASFMAAAPFRWSKSPMRGMRSLPGQSRRRPKPRRNSLRGDLDLVAMARLMPQTIPMREGVTLTEGKVKYEVTTRTEDGKTFWTGHIDTTRIAATIGDEKIAWDEPLRFDFDAHRDKDRFEIDSLDCLSEFLHLSGRGDSGRLHAEAVCDLDRLAARLGDFFGPGFSRNARALTSTLDAHRDDDGVYAFDTESIDRQAADSPEGETDGRTSSRRD